MFQLKLKEKSKTVEVSLALAQLRNSSISFWLDSSGGPSELCKQSFCGVDPKYYIYGSLNETNCFDFIEEKLKEEKENKEGMFVGYVSYDLDFFFAYFDNVIARRDKVPTKQSHFVTRKEIASVASLSRNDMLTSNMTDAEYLEKVKLIKEEIKAGNVYQVNLTREYSSEINSVDELELYLKLRETSPNPYGCFFKTPFVTILSSSPEEFLYIEPDNRGTGEPGTRTIRTRPIKGTLPRNIFEIDPKNKAENIMIVDLERNDLGKICEYGSVKAAKLLDIESYKHLNHVVSTVEGKLRPNVTLRQIFEALFPGGSITGAPKIAAMKLIDKIEPTKRGAYTGSFGYIKTNGEMNFNILIRTIFVQNLRMTNDKRRITFNVGGGIVADSDPQAELEEIKLKAKGIMSALSC